MLEEPPLVQVRRPGRRPTQEQIAALSEVPTGFLCDAMNGKGALAHDLTLLDPAALPQRFCGVALTSTNGPDDILALQVSLTLIRPGDVMVAATGRWRGSAVTGDRVLGMCRNAGAVGFVTDGLVRDHEGIVGVGLPVVCAGMTPNSPFSKGPAIVGEPVVLGDVRIATGDLVVADRTGTVVVPLDQIDAVIATVRRIEGLEAEMDAKVATGQTASPAIERLLTTDRVRWL